jgi:hypothetical protein
LSRKGEENDKIHPMRKDWLKVSLIVLYVLGIAFIIGLFINDVFFTDHSSKNTTNNNVPAAETQPKNTNTKAPTLTTLVVEPIVTDPTIISILKHVFYFLVWILLFLLFPIGFTRLKRLKLFNFELEVEKQTENLIDVINVTTQKINFLSKWATEEYANGYASIAKDFTKIDDGMGIVLKSLTDYYSENWQGNVEYKIYPAKTFESTRRIPKVVRDSYKASLARAQAIPINKENKDQAYIKNYLLLAISYENTEYAITLSSYSLEFDEYDAVLLYGLISLAIQYYERTEMLGLLERIDIEQA